MRHILSEAPVVFAGPESIQMRFAVTIALLIALPSVSLANQGGSPDTPCGAGANDPGYVAVHKFDPKRDAAADIQAAVKEAQKTGKRIILDVGGDWCAYCYQMDEFFQQHPDLLQLRDRNFITVAVYFGSENKNEQVLSHYSSLLGIPHFFVLEKDGTLLYSQHVIELREGGRYDPEKMRDFLTKWSPPCPGGGKKTASNLQAESQRKLTEKQAKRRSPRRGPPAIVWQHGPSQAGNLEDGLPGMLLPGGTPTL